MASEFVEEPGELDPFDPRSSVVEDHDAAQRQGLLDDQERIAVEHLQQVYRRVFVEGKPLEGDVNKLLTDLAIYCRGYASTFHENQRMSDKYDGRRDVFLRIMRFTRLSHDTLYRLYTDAKLNPQG